MIKTINTILILLQAALLYSQSQDALTAVQILTSSIEFCGGEKRLSGIKTTELTYLYVGSDNTIATIAEKRETGKKYTQSILSKELVPQTTIFNGKVMTKIEGSAVMRYEEIEKIEEIKLRTYNNIQYGYKELKYNLIRLPDEKFKNFDCYVIQVTAKNGYSTTNFFDKTNYRLLMIVYPNDDKSLMIEYNFKDSVLFNSLILNNGAGGKVEKIRLLDTKINTAISESWFVNPYKDSVAVPGYIRTGKFQPVNDDSVLERTDSTQTETYNQGKDKIKLSLRWIYTDTYGMISGEPLGKNDRSPEKEILVRIVSWNKSGYVCHYFTGQGCGTQEYRIIK